MTSDNSSICISVVSHEQGKLVLSLLRSIERHCHGYPLSVIVTLNIDEPFAYQDLALSFPVTVIKNQKIKGFGANHNTVFKKTCSEDFFCLLNPDIILQSNPFPCLLSILNNPTVGVTGPTLVDSDGQLQDSARQFPTPKRILRRIVKKKKMSNNLIENELCNPDWIAGMFMLFPAAIFAEIGGFDDRYFMYCEDADICMRLKKNKFKTVCTSDVTVIHDPRRTSHRNIRHLWWHINSLLRFFKKY